MLLISGGHSSFYFMKGLEVVGLGGTLDDAVGETFDKIGKVLGLKFQEDQGEKKAINGDEKAFLFSILMKDDQIKFIFLGQNLILKHIF